MDAGYWPMVVFALVGSITPGPVNILALTQSMRQGLTSGLILVAGASVGYTGIVALLANGLHALVLQSAWLLYMRVAAAIYLVHLAWRVARAPAQSITPTDRAAGSSLHAGYTGLISQCINPKAWLYALTGVSLFTSAGQLHSIWLFSLISCLCCAIGVGFWACLGTLLQSHLLTAARQRTANRVLAALLLGTLWPLFA